MKIEKRKSERQTLHVPILYSKIENSKVTGAYKKGTIMNLSCGGALFKCEEPCAIETDINMKVEMPVSNKCLDIAARIVRVETRVKKGTYYIAVAFAKIDQASRDLLVSEVKELDIYKLLDFIIKEGASDLHLSIDKPPAVRIKGKIKFLNYSQLQNKAVETMIYPLLDDEKIKKLEETKELNFAFSPTSDSRFRANLHWQKGFLEATFRSVPSQIKSLNELGLPPIAEKLALNKNGLVLITGTTGAGKTTTVASMIELINNMHEGVIISIEDPIEYVHASKKSLIKQREIGTDTLSYYDALKSALRQDPDVIVIGEIIDRPCLLAALKAAETGHLVITTFHSFSVAETFDRMFSLLPTDSRAFSVNQIARCLKGVICQALLPGTEKDQVLATEVLVPTEGVRNIIREGKLLELQNSIQTGAVHGMHSFENSIRNLCQKGLITMETMDEYLQQFVR
ncbi:MAG: PilT/PilU family type 4a pilus ATPase [Candidatus Omnitrophota bacterium]